MDDDVLLTLENMADRVSYAMRMAKMERKQREDDLIDLFYGVFCLVMLFPTTTPY